VFPFILASHTSIWLQPNDGGVNKCFHQAIEQCCLIARHGNEGVNVPYFNKIFREGWQNFLTAEWLDLQ